MKIFGWKKLILAAGIFLFLIPGNTYAANVGDVVNFNVDKNFDAMGRTQVPANLVKIYNNFYVYVEKSWWDIQSLAKQGEILISLDSLSNEFDNKIYPTLTSLFGSEWKPGIDNDNKITVFFESMNSHEGGYFRESDEYAKLQVPTSNQREMVYLSLDRIEDPQLKVILAHEFVHLVTFNQKNKISNVEENTWLNEARADYSSAILDYDDQYEGSNLQQRVKDFIGNPSDSLLGWQGNRYDYAVVVMFTHYLADQYGLNILSDSLKSQYVGIESIDYALQRNGFKEDFSKIFTDWTAAVVLNDCSGGTKYCYKNSNLKNFKLLPSLNFLPLTGNVSLSVSNVAENWSGNWIKFIGGNGDLRVNFSSLSGLDFEVPYIVQDSGGSYAVNYFIIDEEEKGEINIAKFGTDYRTLIIIPSLQSVELSFIYDQVEPSYPYTYAIHITGNAPTGDQELMQRLLDRIAVLKQEIAKLQQQKNNPVVQNFCFKVDSNLYFGMTGNEEVSCLQAFLKNQGSDIYPEGLITGYFGSLTRQAVIRFQEKYIAEILSPIGLSSGTGYVGEKTRLKINQLFGS